MNLSIPRLAPVLLTASLWTISTLMSIAPAITAESKSPFIFECSRDPQTRIYSTIIKYTSGKNKELIRWKSNEIANPKSTCRDVSDKFDAAWENQKLYHLTTGKSRQTGANLVCISVDSSTSCSDRNKLFELLPGKNPNVVKDMLKIRINSSDRNLEPIWQNSGDEITIDLRPLIEE